MRFHDDTPEAGSVCEVYPRDPPVNLIRDVKLLRPQNFFAFEGYDGSGKSTVLQEVVKICATRNIKAVSLKLAGSDLVRHAMERAKWLNADPVCFNLLNWVSLFHQTNELKPLYNTERIILFDRYTMTVKVRGISEGLEPTYMDSLEAMIPRPTGTFLIDCDPRISVARIRACERSISYFEMGKRHVSAPLAPMIEDGDWERKNKDIPDERLIQIFNRMRIKYKRLAASYANVHFIDNSGPLNDSAAHIMQYLPLVSAPK